MIKPVARALALVAASILFALLCGIQGLAQAADRPTLLWKFATNDWVLSLAPGPKGTVYAGTWAAGTIYVLSPDGVAQREISVGRSPTSGIDELAVGNDGTIYAGSMDEQLYALAPDGTRKWKTTVSGRTLAVGQSGEVYVDSSALDPRNGEPLTKFPGQFAALGADDTIYVQDDGISAFDSQGRVKWKSPPHLADVMRSGARMTVGDDGTIYAASFHSYVVQDPVTGVRKYVHPPLGVPRYRVVALDPRTGSIKWSFDVRGKVFAVVKGHGDTILAGSYDGHIYALDSETGALRWKFWSGGEWGKMPVHAVAVGSDGTVYAGAGSSVEAIRPP